MSRTAVRSRDVKQAVAFFQKLPRQAQYAIVGVAVVGLVLYAAGAFAPRPVNTTVEAEGDGVAKFVFVSWNVENLFDDKLDKRGPADREYDGPFADDAKLRTLKYDHIADALLSIGKGRGPDIIACMEVESVRAAEILTGVLNSKVRDPNLKYVSFAMKNLDGGRHIAPCVISRLPLSQAATRLHGNRIRILESRLTVNGHELAILATHWTSKLQQRDGGNGEGGRENYARTIARVYADMLKKNLAADVIVCGDFNATPDEEEVTTDLGAVGDAAMVKASASAAKPLLLDLFAGKNPQEYGTLWYNGKPLVYDHLCVSPGMLDATGWTYDPGSEATFTRGLAMRNNPRRPWRFGDPANEPTGGRGFADHFPVVMTITVEANAKKE